MTTDYRKTLKKIGKYHIDSVLGKGTMGLVYKAHDPLLDRWVALKTISSQSVGEDTIRVAKERFTIEAKACARLNHPNIVSVY